MTENIVFKNKKPIPEKLISFGFHLKDNVYTYSCPICNGQFELHIFILPDGSVQTKLIDPDTNDEYTLHLDDNATGRFVGKVRGEYGAVLKNIAESCFETNIFQTEDAHAIIRHIENKYHDSFEYLWKKFPENAIVRRKDNQKWYALLLTVKASSIGLKGADKIEILDLRMTPEKIETSIDHKSFFAGYHMNKKYWITIRLDGSVSLPQIYELISDSYRLAGKQR